MLHNQVRPGGAQLFQRVVAGEHGAGMHAAVPGGGDVVFHVADEQRFLRLQLVFPQNFVDLFALVPDIGVGLVNKGVKAVLAALGFEMVAVDGAQQKRAEPAGAAELQKGPRVRELGDRVLELPIGGVEPFLELRHGHVRRVPVVETGEGQLKFRAKLRQRHRGLSGLREDKIGRLQHGGQIIHQRARPVENDVADHGSHLTTKHAQNTKKNPWETPNDE